MFFKKPELKIPPWPHGRQYIGKVTTMDGHIAEIYLPIVYDVRFINSADSDYIFQLAAACLGISYQEFCLWNVNDSGNVMKKIAAAMVSLTEPLPTNRTI